MGNGVRYSHFDYQLLGKSSSNSSLWLCPIFWSLTKVIKKEHLLPRSFLKLPGEIQEVCGGHVISEMPSPQKTPHVDLGRDQRGPWKVVESSLEAHISVVSLCEKGTYGFLNSSPWLWGEENRGLSLSLRPPGWLLKTPDSDTPSADIYVSPSLRQSTMMESWLTELTVALRVWVETVLNGSGHLEDGYLLWSLPETPLWTCNSFRKASAP